MCGINVIKCFHDPVQDVSDLTSKELLYVNDCNLNMFADWFYC